MDSITSNADAAVAAGYAAHPVNETRNIEGYASGVSWAAVIGGTVIKSFNCATLL